MASPTLIPPRHLPAQPQRRTDLPAPVLRRGSPPAQRELPLRRTD